MIVAYCFHQQDQGLALRNAFHMVSLPHQKPHRFLVGHDSRCNPSEVVKALSPGFQIAGTVSVKDPHSSWPASANTMFAQMAREMEYRFKNDKFFLWLEPDAIVLKENAFDTLEQEYIRVSGTKKFMGALVPEYRDPKGGVSPTHLSGIGIYPNPLVAYAGMMLLSAGENVPFDLISAEAVVQQSHFTDKIQHKWGRFNNDPPFTKENWKERITSECLIFHADKKGDLIDILKDMRIPKEGETNNGMVYRDGGWRNILSGDKEVVKPNARGETLASSAKRVSTDFVGSNPAPPHPTLKERRQAQAAKAREAKAVKREARTFNPSAQYVVKGHENSKIEPWNNRIESIGEINRLCQSLKQFCAAPIHIKRVRDELKKVGVIR